VVKRYKTLIHFTTRHRYIAISQKRLEIDGYIQRGVSPALNPLSIHVTFTAIVPLQGRTHAGEATMCK